MILALVVPMFLFPMQRCTQPAPPPPPPVIRPPVRPWLGPPGARTAEDLSGPAGPTRPRTGGQPVLPPPSLPLSGGARPTNAQAIWSLGEGFDSSTWSTWWRFNREAFFQLGLPGTNPTSANRGASDASVPLLARRVPETLVRERIVPELLRALERDPSSELRSTLLLSLAHVGNTETSGLSQSELTDLFVSHLADPNRGVCENAIVSLGVLGHSSALPVLGRLLQDSDEGRALLNVDCGSVSTRARAFSAYGIGLVGSRSPNPDVRCYAASLLLATLDGEEARPDVQVASVIGLGLLADDAETEAGARASASSAEVLAQSLLEIFTDEERDDYVRAHTATSLARLAPRLSTAIRTEICEAFLDALALRSRECDAVRESAALSLGLLGDADADELDERIRACLLEAAKHGKLRTRDFALIALAQVAGRAGEGAGDPWAGTEEVRSYLLRGIVQGKRNRRGWLAISYGVLGNALARSGRPLSADETQALAQGAARAKAADAVAAYALGAGLCREPGAAASLVEGMQRFEGANEYAHCALALGLLGSHEALEPLRQTLRESRHRPEVLLQTSLALALLDDSTLVPTLLAVDCDCLLSWAGTAMALGRTGDARAVEPLIAALRDERATEGRRTWAARALGLMADKDRKPWTSRLSRNLNYVANPATLLGAPGSGILALR